MDINPPPAILAQAHPVAQPLLARVKRWLRGLDRIFLLTVATPTLLAVVYFGLVASNVYISESRFIVRGQQPQMPTGLGALLQGSVFSRSQEDAYSVLDFVLSRDALRELDAKLHLRKMFTRPDIDVVGRFPGMGWDDSFEALYKYYQGRINIQLDTSSAISTLEVRAYAAEDARSINAMLLDMSERLINQLNQRSRRDMIQLATEEVKRAEERARAASLAIAAFRTDRSIFDPKTESALQLEGVAKLREQLLATEAQLAQVRRVSPRNPQVDALSSHAESLRQAIAAETAKVLGGGKGSLNAKAPAYERLLLEQGFADKQLASAMASLEQARYQAALKQLYLERLAQPSLPDEAMEPRRLRAIATVLVLGLIAWGVVSLVLASVKEHSA